MSAYGLLRALGYETPAERRAKAFFQPGQVDATGQPVNRMNLAGVNEYLTQNPQDFEQVKPLIQVFTAQEELKNSAANRGILEQNAARAAAEEQRKAAEFAAGQEAVKLDENKREGVKSLFAAFGPEKATQLVADYGNLYALPKDITERAQKVTDVATGQANALEKEAAGFEQQKTLEGIKQENKLAENVQQAQLTSETNRIQSGLTLGNQKAIEDYKAKIEAGKPAKPPAGFFDTGGGKVAPLPGTPAHTQALTGLNALNGTLSLIDRYSNLANSKANLFAGKTAQQADQIQGLLAQQIAQANNPGRAPTDADIEAARKLVPSVTDFSDRVKGANKLAVLKAEFLKKQQQQFQLISHYPGAQDYTPELPAGFTVIKK